MTHPCHVNVRSCTAFEQWVSHIRPGSQHYGPPSGSAEINVGRILREDFSGLRDELIISTNGWDIRPGPWVPRITQVPDGQSRSEPAAFGVDYVDIFCSHRADPETPLEETGERSRPPCTRAKRSMRGSRPPPAPGVQPRCWPTWGPATDPSAVVLDAQPLDRGRTARHVGRGRLRVHRLQSTRRAC